MIQRPRRLRNDVHIRSMVKETKVSQDSLILPLFIKDGSGIKNPLQALENHFQYSVDTVCTDIEKFMNQGVGKFMLFGIPDEKDCFGSQAYAEDGVVNRSIREIKKQFGSDIYLISDVCMCEYTSHGHCGILDGETVDNDATLGYLSRIAVSNAQAGVDMVAPSDMMDGRVLSIREGLDANAFTNIPIMAYSAKYASCFYNPFREAADSAPSFGDRKTYQMDYHNTREAVKELLTDESEGADIVMVKPALSYLDIIAKAKEQTLLPVAAYSVSGEYAMMKASHKAGLMDEYKLICETTTSIYRAGADILISYYAPEIVQAIRRGDI
ncbi:MAG: porphobilinogen synthase [Lachnospiraceae bacterium]